MFIDEKLCHDFFFFKNPKGAPDEHYVTSIKTQGTPDEYNTELPEHLHISFSKVGYHKQPAKLYCSNDLVERDKTKFIYSMSTYVGVPLISTTTIGMRGVTPTDERKPSRYCRRSNTR